jgi:hypothetical protein
MTQPLIPPDFLQNIIASSTAIAVEIMESVLMVFWVSLQPYCLYVVASVFLLFIIASVRAMLGRTGMLGSLVYHVFYFGFLALIIWIKGLEILLNPFFGLIGFIVYVACYWLVGIILQKFRNRY